MAEPLGRELEFEVQFGQVAAAQVAKFDMLEIVPNPFIGVEFGCVARQLLQLEAGGGTLGEKVFDGLSAVDRGAIPDYEQRPREMAEQVAQEADHLRAAERLLPDLHEQPSVHRQATDHRELVVSHERVQDRRFAPGGVGADHSGERIKGGLVYPDDGTLLALGFA